MAITAYLLHFSYKLLYFAEVITYAKWNWLIYALDFSWWAWATCAFSVWNLTMICFTLSCKLIKDWVTKTAFSGKENVATYHSQLKKNKNWTKDKIVQQHPLRLSFRWAIKTLYPLELQNPCFTVMWGLFWVAKWLKLSAEWIKQLYLMFTWYQYGFAYQNESFDLVPLLGWTHTGMAHTVMRNCAVIMETDTKKQEGTGMNLYENENHTGVM